MSWLYEEYHDDDFFLYIGQYFALTYVTFELNPLLSLLIPQHTHRRTFLVDEERDFKCTRFLFDTAINMTTTIFAHIVM